MQHCLPGSCSYCMWLSQDDKACPYRKAIMIIMTVIVDQCFTTADKTQWKWLSVVALVIEIKKSLLYFIRLFVMC